MHLKQPGQLLVYRSRIHINKDAWCVNMMTDWSRLCKEVASIHFVDDTHLIHLSSDPTPAEDGILERLSRTTFGVEI